MISWIKKIAGTEALEEEKSRLEAFLSAVPGEYCGFSKEGAPVFSRGFVELLQLRKLENTADISNALKADSAAAFESMVDRMNRNGHAFTVRVERKDGEKVFALTGTVGQDLKFSDHYRVFWLTDETQHVLKSRELEEQAEFHEQAAEKLNSALDQVRIPMWIRNAGAELEWSNKTYADMLGSTPADIIAEQKELPLTALQKTKKSISNNPLKKLAKEALAENDVKTVDMHSILSGNRRLLRISEAPVREHSVTIGHSVDLTREEDLESELKRYLSANRELLEQLRSAISIFTADQKLEFYNSAFSQLWHLNDQWLNTHPSLGEIMEKLRESRRLPEQADFRKYKQSWLSMFTDLIDPAEDMLYLPDGSALRMLVIPHPMGGLMMTFEDVTSRLELESSYNTLIAVQKETLDNLAEGVVVFGSDGRVKLWNPTYAKMWGLNPEDLDGEPHITRVTERRKEYFSHGGWEQQKEEMIKLGLERRQKEGRLVRKDGCVLDYTTVPLPDGGVLISWSDVSDSVQVENALREKNAALEAAERLKLDFLANVSYQLRTPLNAIMGFNEILENEYFGQLNDRQKEYTRSMHDAGERLLNLINDILDLSTIEAGYLTLERGDVKLYKLLSDMRDLMGEWARKEKIDVEVNCPRNIGTIHADERRLKQVLLNLIRNAITFTPQGGKISLSASRTGGEVRIIVSDTGSGISKEDQQRIFQPFERVQNTVRQDGVSARGGAGLGLSLVKNIIELHGGRISLESETGEGTSVILRLPRNAREEEEAAAE